MSDSLHDNAHNKASFSRAESARFLDNPHLLAETLKSESDANLSGSIGRLKENTTISIVGGVFMVCALCRAYQKMIPDCTISLRRWHNGGKLVRDKVNAYINLPERVEALYALDRLGITEKSA